MRVDRRYQGALLTLASVLLVGCQSTTPVAPSTPAPTGTSEDESRAGRRQASVPTVQMAVFQQGGQDFALDMWIVHEIMRPAAITAVPNMPTFVEGVVDVRGRKVPVIDFAKRAGFPAQPDTEDTRIMLIELAGTAVGLRVGAVSEVLRLPETAIVAPQGQLPAGLTAEYVRGIGKLEGRTLILIDIDRLLTIPEMQGLLNS